MSDLYDADIVLCFGRSSRPRCCVGALTARLPDQITAAAEIWAQAEYQTGLEDGRHGLRSVHVARQRVLAEQRFRDVEARLSAAVSPPAKPAQGKMRL